MVQAMIWARNHRRGNDERESASCSALQCVAVCVRKCVAVCCGVCAVVCGSVYLCK